MNGKFANTLPYAASEVAESWDTFYIWMNYLLIAFFILVIGLMVLFALKYRARPGKKSSDISHHDVLEFVWTAVPTVLVMAIFAWSWIVYRQMTEPPTDAMEVKVMAQSWAWNFQYDDGRTTQNQLFVPVNKPVKLVMTSKMGDVLHSFFLPNMRVKQDVVPGMYTYTWFKANTTGQHQIFCTEYCGTGHSAMLAKLIVLSEEDYKAWKWGKEIKLPPVVGLGGVQVAMQTSQASDAKNIDVVQVGRNLMASKGCIACHSDDGSARVGPSHKGIFGHSVELTNGQTIIADENYIRESIEAPQAKIVKGFEVAAMPSYKGQLSDDEIGAIIAYIKSLK